MQSDWLFKADDSDWLDATMLKNIFYWPVRYWSDIQEKQVIGQI